MSRFMFVMFEGGGNVPVQLAIAKRLVARGHAAHVLADAPLREQALAAGCTFATFPTAPAQNFRDREADRVRDWSIANPMKQLARVASELVFGPAERYARDVLAEIERHPTDAIAVDCLLFGAMVGAERSGLPTAQLHHIPFSWPTRGVPPFGLGLHPARGPLGRFRDRMLGAITTRTFERNGLPPVNAARVALGMQPLASVFEQAKRQDRVLVLTSKRFDFAGHVELPANVVHVGPQLDDPAWVAPWTSPWTADDQRPLVLVALGSTFQNQGSITQRVIDALGSLPVRGLVTLGGVLSPSDFVLPPNVSAVGSAPHQTVMPLARAVVAHGGHGTVMKALSYGKPLLCVPLGRDQADNAARVEVAGAGLRASAKASASTLRTAIVRLIDEPSYAERAKEMADDIARDVAADRAVAELESLPRSTGRRLPVLATLADTVCP